MSNNNIVCPKCFSKHTEKELAWGCSNSDCSREAVPTISTSLVPNCESCGKALTMRFCPECGYQIMVGEEALEHIPLSIVGSQGAGKSNYLSVLINEIRHSMGKTYQSSLYPSGGDDTILQYENRYYKPLYEEGTCVPSTQQDDVRPLVYSMVFNKENVGKVSTITFYDACGENFRNERTMADYNRSIYNSKGIIFLVDPSQLPGIREEYLANDIPVLEDDFGALLSRTIQLIRDGSGQRNLKKKIDIPIAICISKLDTLKDKIDPSSFLNYPSRQLNQPYFDVIDHSCVNLEVQALIEYWSGNDLLNQVQSQFEHVGFFAFSALGNTPTEQNRLAHVAPTRVLDPFVWLLARNRVIRAKRNSPIKD